MYKRLIRSDAIRICRGDKLAVFDCGQYDHLRPLVRALGEECARPHEGFLTLYSAHCVPGWAGSHRLPCEVRSLTTVVCIASLVCPFRLFFA